MSYPPENCLEVRFVNSCLDTNGGQFLSGVFSVYEGEACVTTHTGGRPVYYDAIWEVFLFFFAPHSKWFVGSGCGTVVSGVAAYGGSGWHPFEDTAASMWQCENNGQFVAKPASVQCSLYDGELLSCVSGSYESSGVAPNGECR